MLRLVIVPVLISMGGAILLITGVMGTARQPEYPASWLLYDIRHADNFEIYRMNPEDLSTTTLKTGGYYFYPVGSPTGSKFAYWGWQNKRWHLYETRIDGGQTRVVLANQRNLLSHYWSKNGVTLETYLQYGGIYRDSHDRVDGNPIISPNGRWIAFISRRAPGGIYRRSLNAGDSQYELIVSDYQIADYSLTWSPDGQWIAYVSRKGGETAIYRARIDGTQIERLTTENQPYRRLSWIASTDLHTPTALLTLSSLALLICAATLFTRTHLPLTVIARTLVLLTYVSSIFRHSIH